MEAHRGSILVESEEGNGTKITLTFPVQKAEPQISQK
jgi:signal transduction histidine kinase